MIKYFLLEEELFITTDFDIVKVDEFFIYIKPKSFSEFDALKDKIPLQKHSIYCDCKKILMANDIFEEVIQVKNEKKFTEGLDYGKCFGKFHVYGYWKSDNSYGPMIKLEEYTGKETVQFIADPDEYNSDEEINESIQYYAKIKGSSKIRRRRNKQQTAVQ